MPYVNKSALEKLLALWETERKEVKRAGDTKTAQLLERVSAQVKEAMNRHPSTDYIYPTHSPIHDLSAEPDALRGRKNRGSA